MIQPFDIEPARDDDWPWISHHHAEIAWASLSPKRQEAVEKAAVLGKIAELVTKSREEHGQTNQAFVARDTQGRTAGFVWVEAVQSRFTGESIGYVLAIYVAPDCRGRGLGRLLMARAEDWAQRRSCPRIGLSVANHNQTAIGLYEAIGYRTETLRMSKSLR